MKTTSKRYGVAELAVLLADLARPVADAAAAEGITWRAVRGRTHRAAVWAVALLTGVGRRTTVRPVAAVTDDGQRSQGRAVVWAGRVRVEPVGFRAVAWEPADMMTSPADPVFAAPAPVPAFRAVQWEPDMSEPADPAFVAPVATPIAAEPTPAAEPTRKPRARKPATPKVKLMDSAARVTEPPAPVATVYTADVRPIPLARLAAGLNSTRFSGALTVRAGWATDGKVAVRVAEADGEALAAKVEEVGTDMGGFRAPPVGDLLPKGIDPRPFVLTAREWDGDQEPVGVLTREDGAVRRVDLRLYLTLIRHMPKGTALYAMPGHARTVEGRPLVAFAGDAATYTRATAAGLLMPLPTDGAGYTPWTADDEPLTLRHGRAAGASYTLTRGEWKVLLPYLTGADPLADLEAAGGTVAFKDRDRAKLAALLAAVGREAVAKLLGEEATAAA